MGIVREYGYEYDAVPNGPLWDFCDEKTVTRTDADPTVWLLRSGRDAFKIIAREYPDAVVLMPALSCSSMSGPFELYGQEVRYYRLLPNYTVDIENVTAKIHGNEIELIFLYMDYFGNRALQDDALQWLQKQYPTMRFVYDRTHTLLYENTSHFKPDFVVGSLRKWAPIADGGLLWSQLPLRFTEFCDDISFAKDRLEAQTMRNRFFETGDLRLKSRYRTIFSTVTDRIDDDVRPCGMSLYSLELARNTDWQLVRENRRTNAEILLKILRENGVRTIQSQAGISDLYVAFYTEHRDKIQQQLAQKGIFCTVIWPLDEKKRKVCETAYNTERGMLAAPCDQRYTQVDMLYIANEIVRALNE